ncbi:MAG: glycerophosphodiester phosphodiesterase family protein [Leptospiraceae bacterium]
MISKKAAIRYGVGFIALAISTYFLTVLTVTIFNSGRSEEIQYPASFFEPAATNLVFAHRGLTDGTIENTIPSFERAIELGTDVLEIDVQITLDGTVVLFHDSDLTRLAGRPETIAQLSLAQIQQLRIPYGCLDGCQTIPTLEQFLTSFPDHPTNIELKTESKEMARLVATMLASRQDRKDVIVGSAHSEAVEEFRRHSSLPTSAHTSEVIQASVCFLLQARCRFDFQALQLPYRPNSILPALRADPDFLEWARQRGLRTHYWTINDAKDMKTLLERNVDGLMTDYPGRALEIRSRLSSKQ